MTNKIRGLYCTVCGRSFVGKGGAFNTHKVGHFGLPIYRQKKSRKTGAITQVFVGYGEPTRRCMTDEEMVAAGLGLVDGLWAVVEKNEQNQWDSHQQEEDQEIEEDEAIFASA
jgi:hypothetical protein